MTDEQLAEYERWAQAWSRVESVGSRRVLELVAEVRRLKAEYEVSVPADVVFRELLSRRPNPAPAGFKFPETAEELAEWIVSLVYQDQREVTNCGPVLIASTWITEFVSRKAALGQTREQPAPLPPFPGILAGITAADVYGVQV